MAVPYLQARYGSGAPERVGLKHPSIAPYGSYACEDGRELVISIQNEREWKKFCDLVLQRPGAATDPRFESNAARTTNRDALDSLVAETFAQLTYGQAVDRLTDAQTAFGAINTVHDLIEHPQLRTKPMNVNGREIEMPAAPYKSEWDAESFPPVPRLGEHKLFPTAQATKQD